MNHFWLQSSKSQDISKTGNFIRAVGFKTATTQSVWTKEKGRLKEFVCSDHFAKQNSMKRHNKIQGICRNLAKPASVNQGGCEPHKGRLLSAVTGTEQGLKRGGISSSLKDN